MCAAVKRGGGYWTRERGVELTILSLQVDNLMESYNLSCTGDSAVDVVAIEHKGYHLYPVGMDDGEQLNKLVTAAAFVPQHLMASGSSNDS